MTDRASAPWHLWVVGLLSLLWNAGGGFEWGMAHFAQEQYLGMMTEEQRDWYTSFPLWAEAFWALGVWGAIIGSLLLLLRSRHASLAFLLSLIGLVGNSLHSIVSMEKPLIDMMGPGSMIFSGAIVVVAVLLWFYARAMARRGVLT